MAHPLADAVQPLIDQWLASDEGIIAEMEFAGDWGLAEAS